MDIILSQTQGTRAPLPFPFEIPSSIHLPMMMSMSSSDVYANFLTRILKEEKCGMCLKLYKWVSNFADSLPKFISCSSGQRHEWNLKFTGSFSLACMRMKQRSEAPLVSSQW
jgi:hypothetical protein